MNDVHYLDLTNAEAGGGSTETITAAPYRVEKDDRIPEVSGKRAVFYLRVSSKKQVATDFDPEGISLPAQRKSCERKAEQLGLEVVDEYIEPGVSGTETSKRVAFQEMLERIRTQRDVDYVVIYKLSRLHRNRLDEAFTMAELRKRGVTLLSATEHIDDTPTGRLMQGILSAFNEFRSAEDGADIAYKLGEKAKKGGTISMAPLGYINVGQRVEDREVRTVEFDPDRAPLVKLGFELYATGKYSAPELAEELFHRGLRTRATSARAAKQISVNQLLRILQDPYYVGFVTYKGEVFKGRHDPLIDAELFARVQEVISTRSTGERKRIHEHYLKGSLYCGNCHQEGRTGWMVLANVKGRGDDVYEYFFCRQTQERLCDSRYAQVPRIEQAVERFWSSLRLSSELVERIRSGIQKTIHHDQKAARDLHAQLTEELRRLDVKQENLLDLAADGELPKDTIKKRLNDITAARKRLIERQENTEHKLAAVLDYIDAAIDLLENPGQLYLDADEGIRRKLNQAIFKRLYVYIDEVTDAELNAPFADLIEADRLYRHDPRTGAEGENKRRASLPEGSSLPSSTATALLHIALDDVSSNGHVVDLRGLEPLTPCMPCRCATSCATGPDAASRGNLNRLLHPQSGHESRRDLLRQSLTEGAGRSMGTTGQSFQSRSRP